MSTQKKRAALYARVSTLLNQDPGLQLINMKEFASNRGFQVVGEYVDKGVSGTREKRPALDKLVLDARAGKIDYLVVSAVDRLGRSARHLINLIAELRSYNVNFISLREAIDLSTAQGELVFNVLSAVSQLERSLISERISSSLAAKKLVAQRDGSGWRCGRPLVATSDVSKRIVDLRTRKFSIRKIAKEVGVSTATVQRVLKANCT